MKETELKEMSTTMSTKSGTMENEDLLDQSSMKSNLQSTSSSELTQSVTNSIETKNSESDVLWDLKFWDSTEWRIINDRLDYLESIGFEFSPARGDMYRALERTQPDEVRVVLLGQDPYPDRKKATGYAFAIPRSFGQKDFPPTLKGIFSEYCSDLSLPSPTVGDLSGWIYQGVLLWNVIPSTNTGSSLVHDWREYDSLTFEILDILDRRGVVFAFLGAVPRRFAGCIKDPGSRVIECSHPSPRGSLSARSPFRGSRIFSTINNKLREIGKEPIDWRLP